MSVVAVCKLKIKYAPVAQLDRVFGYEPKGRGFESLQARFKLHLRSFLFGIQPRKFAKQIRGFYLSQNDI